MKKSVLALILAVLMAVGLLTIGAAADDVGTVCTDEDCEHVAAIDDTHYDSLAAAVTAAQNGNTITLLKSTEGSGVQVIGSSERTLTIDLNNCTYTIVDPTVGSSGTETNGFQLLKGSTITIKDGTITSDKAKLLIQNYSNLTLDNVKLDGSKLASSSSGNYTLSNNCGNVVISDSTIIAKEGQFAFDVYYWPKNGYTEGVTVTVEGNSVITGRIEYGSDGTADGKADIAEKAKLNITGGTFTGSLSTYNLGTSNVANITVTGGTFKAADGGTWDIEDYIQPGMGMDEDGNVVISDDAVASVGKVGYDSLESAIEAAPAGATIELRKNVQMTSKVVIGKNLTIDGKGKTITGSADDADVNFEVTNGTVTFKNAVVTGFGKNAATNNDITVFLVTGDSTVFNAEYLTVNEFCRAAFAIEGGKFNIDNCDVDCSNTAENHLTKAVSVKAGASKVEGSITNTKISGANSTYANWSTAGIEIFTNAYVEIENCTLDNCDYGIWVDNYYDGVGAASATSADVKITDTDVQSTNDAVLIFGDYLNGKENSASININGGTYEGNGAVSLWNAKTIEDSGVNSITIENGTFIGAVAAYSADEGFEPVKSTKGNSLVVKGGSFDSSVTDYLAENLKYQLEGSDGMFSYYDTLSAAMAAAVNDNGAVITGVGSEAGGQNYTITYVYGNGMENFVQTWPAGSYTLPAAPSKPGYIFLGWRCGNDTYGAGDSYTLSGNMTFTAIWANMPDITPGTPDDDDEPVVPDFPFTDVREGQWFYEAVKYVYDEGIMNGMDRYTFDPNGSLTRAMVWTMLARHEGVDTEGGATWYAKAQEWAVEAGVSDGTDPMGNITREQLVTMLWRLNGSEVVTGSLTGFTDYDKVSDWAGNAMLWATVEGIIEGDEANALNPTAGCTRAQAAAMIMRFCAYHEADSFGTVV